MQILWNIFEYLKYLVVWKDNANMCGQRAAKYFVPYLKFQPPLGIRFWQPSAYFAPTYNNFWIWWTWIWMIWMDMGYLPNFAILFLFSKSSFWYGFYLKNENEKFLFYLKYKENMCGSWFASQFTLPIPPPTNQPNAEIWHINVSVPKTKRWIIQIKNFHFCYQKNKTKQNKT